MSQIADAKDGRFLGSSDGALIKMLKEARTIAVIGLSADQERPSYRVAKYLMGAGYKIIPVNPKYLEILGEKCYGSLADVPGEIDIADVFRKSEGAPEAAREAIKKRVKVLWLQEGVISREAADMAIEAGLAVVMDKCILKEHKRLLGESGKT